MRLSFIHSCCPPLPALAVGSWIDRSKAMGQIVGSCRHASTPEWLDTLWNGLSNAPPIMGDCVRDMCIIIECC